MNAINIIQFTCLQWVRIKNCLWGVLICKNFCVQEIQRMITNQTQNSAVVAFCMFLLILIWRQTGDRCQISSLILMGASVDLFIKFKSSADKFGNLKLLQCMVVKLYNECIVKLAALLPQTMFVHGTWNSFELMKFITFSHRILPSKSTE